MFIAVETQIASNELKLACREANRSSCGRGSDKYRQVLPTTLSNEAPNGLAVLKKVAAKVTESGRRLGD